MLKKMVAKQKRKEAGSSSNQGYESHFFSSLEASELYKKRFKDRKLILGKKILFGDFVGFNLRNLYDYMGWTALCELEGKRIGFSEEILLEVVGIHDHGTRVFAAKNNQNTNSYNRANALYLITSNPNFPLEQTLKNSELTSRAKLLHSLNAYIFLPRSGHRDAINLMDVYLLDRLLTRRQTNIPHIIINHIFEAYKSRSNILSYALLIQKFLDHFEVDIDDKFDEIITLGENDMLGERYLRGLCFRKGDDNRWVLARNPRPRENEKDEDEEGEENQEDGESN